MGKQQLAIASLSIFLTFANLVVAQNTVEGGCPAIKYKVKNLDLQKFSGVWQQYSKIPTAFDAVSSCDTLSFEFLSGGKIQAAITQTADKAPRTILGTGKVTADGLLSITFAGPKGSTLLEFVVLDTDYTTYATLFSCSELAGWRKEFVYILSREVKPSSTSVGAAKQILRDNNLATNVKKVVHTNCA